MTISRLSSSSSRLLQVATDLMKTGQTRILRGATHKFTNTTAYTARSNCYYGQVGLQRVPHRICKTSTATQPNNKYKQRDVVTALIDVSTES